MQSQSQTGPTVAAKPCLFENLEERKLLSSHAPRVTQYYLDNRGQAEFFFSSGIARNSLTAQSVQAFTAGTDGDFGTNDDVPAERTVVYRRGRLVVDVKLANETDADEDARTYRVRLSGLRGTNGELLDGEFNEPVEGRFKWSGDGTAGGNFDVSSSDAERKKARFVTDYGYVNLAFFRNGVETTVTNFEHYANEAAWDGTFVHRSARQQADGDGFGIIQAGGFNVVNGVPAEVHKEDDIVRQTPFDHLKGTIGMARLGGVGNENTNNNQWFFNVTENEGFNDEYTSFGIVLDAASQRTLEAINKLTIVDVDGAGSAFGELPVRDPAAGTQRLIRVPQDLVFFRRVAMLMDVGETGVVGANPASASASTLQAVSRATPPAKAFSATKIARNRVFDDAVTV